MPSDTPELQCRNQECRVAETVKCVEGLALDKCPHFGRVPSASGESTTVEESAATAPVVYEVSLEKADQLDTQGASAILRASPAHLIAIIGPTSSGKTSLIASLCDLFQRGSVEHTSFARSRTFFAFERACHHSRAASLRNVPQMEHTDLGSGVGFYHFAMRDDRTPELVNVLFADRSGEDYRSAADDPSNAAGFVELNRANCITILVTGEQLLDVGRRHNVKQEIVMILQGIIDAAVTSPTQRLALVLTKLDLVRQADDSVRARVERDFGAIVRQVETLFGSRFSEIRSFQIAAAPATTILSHGYGVPDVLQFWTTPWSPAPTQRIHLPRAIRAMSRFGTLEPGEGS